MRRGIIALLIATVTVFPGCLGRHPHDSSLRNRFIEKRAAFEELAAKIEQRPIAGPVTKEEETTILRGGLSAFEDREFSCLKRDDGTVLFIYSSMGLVVGGSIKGIAHVPKMSVRFYEVLPASSEDWPRRESEFIKPLDGDWYLFVLH
jgi:hypothetical protein